MMYVLVRNPDTQQSNIALTTAIYSEMPLSCDKLERTNFLRWIQEAVYCLLLIAYFLRLAYNLSARTSWEHIVLEYMSP